MLAYFAFHLFHSAVQLPADNRARASSWTKEKDAAEL